MKKANRLIDQIRNEGRRVLTEYESKVFLKEAGIPVVETKLARSQNDAVLLSQKMGLPVALKINSPDIVHKSDSGGVKLNLHSLSEVRRAYREITQTIQRNHPSAIVQGITVQRMARPGTEVIVGTSRDPQFGPVIMFGLGGIFVEVLKDVSFRIIPLRRKDAQEMIEEIRGYPLLKGFRGKEPADIPALVDLLLKVSNLVEKWPEIQELDLNPVLAYPKGVLAVDARILLEERPDPLSPDRKSG